MSCDVTLRGTSVFVGSWERWVRQACIMVMRIVFCRVGVDKANSGSDALWMDTFT